jgi:hypothetical protein
LAKIPWAAVAVAAVFIIGLRFVETWDEAQNLYLRWLALYGLVFPAIVLAWCLRGSPKVTPEGLARLIILLVIASVLGDIGLIHGPTWVALLAAAVVLCAPPVIRHHRR